MQFHNGNDLYNIGTDATSNWDILDNSQENDIWVHLADYPSCYIICNIDNTMTFETNAKKKKYIQKRVKVAGRICFNRSQNKIPDKVNKINIIYIKCKYVKKGGTVGQAELTKEPSMLKIEIT